MAEYGESSRNVFMEFSADGTWLGRVEISLNEEKEILEAILQTFSPERRGEFPNRGINMSHHDNYICTKKRISIPPSINFENLIQKMETRHFMEGELGVDIFGYENFSIELMVFTENSDYKHELVPVGLVQRGITIVKEAFARMKEGQDVDIINWGSTDNE